MDFKDVALSGRPNIEDIDRIMEIIELDRHVSTCSIAQELEISHKTVLNHLHKTGLKKKPHECVYYELMQKNLLDRICDSLLKRNEIEPFWKRIMTGDDTRATYENNIQKMP